MIGQTCPARSMICGSFDCVWLIGPEDNRQCMVEVNHAVSAEMSATLSLVLDSLNAIVQTLTNGASPQASSSSDPEVSAPPPAKTRRKV